MRNTAGLILTPLAVLAMLTGVLLVSGNVSLLAAWDRIRCGMPELPRLRRQAILDGSPTLIVEGE